MKQKIIVIGTNHAGTFAVNTLQDNYKDSVAVTTYDSNNNISFLGCGMALWIGNVIDKPDGLFYASPEELQNKGINVYMEHLVEDIDFEKKEVHVKDLKTNELKTDNYDKLIIAVGSWPIKPPIPGIDLENVVFVKLFQHAEHVKKLIADKTLKNVTVVGGGYIGIELVEAFQKNGKNVRMVTQGEVLEKYYDANFREEMKENLINHGIEVFENECIKEIIGNDGKVKTVKSDKNSYDTDLVIMCIGFRANTKFLKDSTLEMTDKGIIKVNSNQETNIKGVYAIGDSAVIHSNATGNDEHIALATNAVRGGIIAGHNAGGMKIGLNGVQGSNAIHVYNLTLTSTGITEDVAKLNNIDVDSAMITDTIRPEFMPNNEDVTIKVVWDKKTLKILGAQIMSKENITLAIHMFSLAIEVGYTIDRLATLDLFFLPHFNKPVNFITAVGLKALDQIQTY